MFSSGTRRKLGHKNETLLERTKQCLWSHMKTSHARRHSYLLASLSVFRVGNLPGSVQEATGNLPVILGQMGAQVNARTLGNSTA